MIYKFYLLLGILLFMGIASLYAADTPPEMSGNDISPKYFTEANTPVELFPAFTITGPLIDGGPLAGPIKGLTISFSAGHHNDQDNLSVPNNLFGITGSFDKSTGILRLTGETSAQNYQSVVRSITYTNDAASGSVSYDQRELTISFANADYFSQDGGLENGHFYQVVLTAKGFYTSSSEASAKTYYGLQGYLATVTSAGENTFIKNKIPSNIGAVWLGGSDAETEGSWLWTGGPEEGTKFYDKSTNESTGYTNWYSGEPNNANNGEDCLLMYKASRTAGTWGDGANVTGLSYIVEYGGTPGDPTLNMTTTTTLDIVAPQPPVINGNNDSPTYNASEYNPVIVFPNFTVTDAENSDIKGLTIYFSSGYQGNQDTLRFTNTSKITGTFNKTYGALVLSGNASPSEYQAAVRSITYINNAPLFSSIDGSQRQLTISLANADYFSQDGGLGNGHFYEYISSTAYFSNALTAASAKTYYGLQGYLATVTSEEENNFIRNKISANVWLGGSDEDEENIWKWVTGPETGIQFSSGATATGDSYVNWSSGEPNNTSGIEDYLIMNTDGLWNDGTHNTLRGYVVEYGGMSGDPTLNMTTTTTLNITTFAELTWDGSENTDWHTAANWDGNVVPGESYNVTIPGGLVNYPTLSLPGICNNLTIGSNSSSTGSLLGQENLTVNGTTTVERHLAGNAWHLISSPAPGESIVNFLSANTNVPTSGSSRGMMDYDETNNDWNNFFTNAQSGNLTAGKGFSLRTDADGTVTFTGALETGTANTTVARTDNSGWNCVGNPYPSAISVNTAADVSNNFIALNTGNLDESYTSVYVWEETNGAYTIVALNDAAFYAQSGQAFFVKAVPGGTQVQFTTAMQTHQPTAAFKSGTLPWPELNLTASMAGKNRTARLKFNDDMTTGLDVGYDAGVFKTGFDIYTKLIEDNGVEFGLQCLPLSEIKSLEIPVGLDASAGEISFSLQTENFPGDVVPVLNDKLSGEQFAFKNNDDVYTATLSGNTRGYGRFSLSFSNVTSAGQISQPGFRVWYSNGDINISGQTTGNIQVEVFDVNGRKLVARKLTQSGQNRVKAPAGAAGIYLVKVTDAGYNKIFKIVKTEY